MNVTSKQSELKELNDIQTAAIETQLALGRKYRLARMQTSHGTFEFMPEYTDAPLLSGTVEED